MHKQDALRQVIRRMARPKLELEEPPNRPFAAPGSTGSDFELWGLLVESEPETEPEVVAYLIGAGAGYDGGSQIDCAFPLIGPYI